PLVKTHSFNTPDMSADVVIVGGGYVGLSTAFWISEYRPDLKIILLDRSHIGAGASGRNAGFLTHGSATFYKTLNKEWGAEKALSLRKFAEESIDLVYHNILKSSPEIKFEKTNSLTLFQNEQMKEAWQDPAFSPEDYNFQWKGPEDLAPGLKGKFFGAYETGPEYKINPMQLLSTLKMTLESRKIQVIENLSAFEITPDGISTELNTIKCKQVVLAVNGYFPKFHPAFKDLITPCRAQMMAVELEDDIDSNSLHYDSPERVYWRKAQDKILLIGGKRLLDEAGEVGDFEKISGKIQAGLESYLKDLLKVNYKVINRWSGTMGFTEHELPLITKSEATLDTYVIGGFSGHGMGFGFRSAQEMAKLVTGNIKQSFFDSFKTVKIKL
ncbi:MAG: FAD-binding oxidoreductase, partial [Bdellovibrionales bacterium]|nr:FAD-binding oxidoreductase [Bdellovibrionales bacterium]